MKAAGDDASVSSALHKARRVCVVVAPRVKSADNLNSYFPGTQLLPKSFARTQLPYRLIGAGLT